MNHVSGTTLFHACWLLATLVTGNDIHAASHELIFDPHPISYRALPDVPVLSFCLRLLLSSSSILFSLSRDSYLLYAIDSFLRSDQSWIRVQLSSDLPVPDYDIALVLSLGTLVVVSGGTYSLEDLRRLEDGISLVTSHNSLCRQ